MAGIAGVLGLVGAVVSAAGTIAAGNAQAAAAEYEAKQFEIRASEERAAAQREGFEFGKQTRLARSRQQAVAAASGFGALDETVLDLASDTEARGQYQAGIARYAGEERARGNIAQAGARRMEGRAAKQGAMFSAIGTVLGGFGSMFQNYGGGGFQPRPTFRYG